ncbi:hypothetical protein ACFFRR_004164 [Megaselia abdita]
MECVGRLHTIKLAMIPCIAGWIAIAMADNFYVLLIGRILTGLGCAIGTSPAIVYITEVARPDLRGSLMSTAPTIASFGMIIAYAEGAFLHWRLVSWLNIGYTIIPCILVQFFVPESPVWLVSKGRIEDARKSLSYLYKAYPQPEHTTQTLAEMHLCALQREREQKLAKDIKTSKSDSSEKNKFRQTLEAFMQPTGYKPLIVLFWLFLIQQYSGIYITLFFAVTFFQEVGSSIDAFTVSIFVGVTRFLMSLTNAWLLKRFKRRPLLMTSSIGMAACMFISGAFTYWLKNGQTTLDWVPVVFFMLYVCASMMGLLSIPWTMTAEMFPTEIRGIGHSIAYSMANILMFAAIQSYRSLSDALGGAYAVQWFFAGVAILGFFFALIFLPETHGKKLSEIEAYFRGDYKKMKNKSEKSTDDFNNSSGIKINKNLMTKMSKPNLATVDEQEQMIKPKKNNKKKEFA